MADNGPPGLQPIALVFGNEAAAVHVREALGAHASIVYAAPVGDFDAARLMEAGATAALVNLDGGDWPATVEARLNGAGVPVVFNDAEVSRALEGWDRARWLRHLVAKLRGSVDVDPPRPAAAGPAVAARDVPAATAVEAPAEPEDGGVMERPLTPGEIETMTADFLGARASSAGAAPNPTEAGQPASPEDVAAPSAAGTLAETAVADADADLDVDTESLSAMIDARLAEPESQGLSDASETWRIVANDSDPPAGSGTRGQGDPVAAPAGPAVTRAAALAAAPQDDSDVFASLPSLDEWQLVDPEAPLLSSVNGRHKPPQPVPPDSLSGLELLPLDTHVAAVTRNDLGEQWLDSGKSAKSKAAPSGTARRRSGGGKP